MTNILLACATLAAMAAGQEPSPLSLKARIPLPDVTGRMDHLAVDVKGQRLFVSALRNHTVEVLDLQTGRRVRSLERLDEPQGEYFDSSTNRLFIATGDGGARIYDGASLQLLQTVKLSDDADNVRYNGRTRSVVIGYGGEKALRGRPAGSGALAFLDSSGKQLKEIVVDAHPGRRRQQWRHPRPLANRSCDGMFPNGA